MLSSYSLVKLTGTLGLLWPPVPCFLSKSPCQEMDVKDCLVPFLYSFRKIVHISYLLQPLKYFGDRWLWPKFRVDWDPGLFEHVWSVDRPYSWRSFRILKGCDQRCYVTVSSDCLGMPCGKLCLTWLSLRAVHSSGSPQPKVLFHFPSWRSNLNINVVAFLFLAVFHHLGFCCFVFLWDLLGQFLYISVKPQARRASWSHWQSLLKDIFSLGWQNCTLDRCLIPVSLARHNNLLVSAGFLMAGVTCYLYILQCQPCSVCWKNNKHLSLKIPRAKLYK